MRSKGIRSEVLRLVRQAPFRPFVLSLENGDRVPINRPENIAFDPEGDSPDFYVIHSQMRLFSSFDAVTNVATPDSVDELTEPGSAA